MPTNLLDFDQQGLVQFFIDLGEEPGKAKLRARQALRWLHHNLVHEVEAMTTLAKTTRQKLRDAAFICAPSVIRDSTAKDGTRKWLLAIGNDVNIKGGAEGRDASRTELPAAVPPHPGDTLATRNAIEAVFIPEGELESAEDLGVAYEPRVDARAATALRLLPRQRYRGTLCISSQAGCALDCSFCSTGKQGFNRNLTVSEIIGQLWHANRALLAEGFKSPTVEQGHHPITNVVMMGMGEPLANFDNVVTAMRIMLDDSAYGLSRRRVTLSTSGMVPWIDRLRDACPVALAVSLHAPTDALRDQLVPINRKYPLQRLLDACLRYIERAPRDFVTFEYVMLDGVNDSLAHAEQLLELVRRVPCKFNLIPFNPFPNSGFTSSPRGRIVQFQTLLADSGIVTTIRKTRGDDIDAACGQLAGRVYDKTRRQIVHRVAKVSAMSQS